MYKGFFYPDKLDDCLIIFCMYIIFLNYYFYINCCQVYANRVDPDQLPQYMPYYVASDLGLHYVLKFLFRDTKHYWVNTVALFPLNFNYFIHPLTKHLVNNR